MALSSIHNPSTVYRAEIDGLRAVAVLPVLLFHAGVPAFSGGFVGVDIFFVISGYLITSILLAEMALQKFSLAGFYERRARRIVPALAFVILCCLPAAWMWLIPEDFSRFGESLVGVALFSSNLYFWKTTDYFGPAAEEQPLLHTWSLAVEEQYYLLFPLFLLLVRHLGRGKMLALAVALGIASLLLSELAWRSHPDANFYLLPTRSWELLAGAVLAFGRRAGEPHGVLGPKANEGLAAIGAGLILLSTLIFDKSTPFPSLYAIVPVLGTVLVISFATPSTVVGRVLATPTLVAIGAVSYGAYLWHQPLLVFYRSVATQPDLRGALVMVLASLVLAALSYRFVELPFRRRSVCASRRSMLLASLLALVLMLAAGAAIHLAGGFERRFDEQERYLIEKYGKRQADWRDGRCFIHSKVDGKPEFDAECFGTGDGKPRLFLIGDSHAAALYPGVRSEFTQDFDIAQLTMSWCMPFVQLDAAAPKTCRQLNPSRFDTIRRAGPGTQVIIHANWSTPSLAEGERDRQALQSTLHELAAQVGGKNVTVVGCVPHWDPSLPKWLLKKRLFGQEAGLPVSATNNDGPQRAKCNEFIGQVAAAEGVNFINGWDAFCQGSLCRIRNAPQGSEPIELVTFDYAHLTSTASAHLARRIRSSMPR